MTNEQVALLTASIGVFGTALGAAIAMIGNTLTNRGQVRLHTAQLKHDSDQRNREREMSLRVDVYLRAAEAVAKSQSLLSAMANIDVPDGQILQGYQDDFAAFGKINVVGSMETVRALSAFSNAFGSYVLEILLKRIALTALKNRINVLNEMAETAMKQSGEAFSNSLKAITSGSIMKDYYSGQSQQYLKDHAEYTRQLEVLRKKEVSDRLELMQLCFDRSLRLGGLIVPAVFAVRNELELPFDKDQFLQLSREAAEKNTESMQGFIRELERMIANAEKEESMS